MNSIDDVEEHTFLQRPKAHKQHHKPRMNHKFVLKARTAALMDSEVLRTALLNVLQGSAPKAQIKLFHAGMSGKMNGKARR